jgi:heme/copper-type cytochrome/quinol oxidase subunit 2
VHFNCGKCDDITTYTSVALTFLIALFVEVLVSIIYLKCMDRSVVDKKLKIMSTAAPAILLVFVVFLLDYFL